MTVCVSVGVSVWVCSQNDFVLTGPENWPHAPAITSPPLSKRPPSQLIFRNNIPKIALVLDITLLDHRDLSSLLNSSGRRPPYLPCLPDLLVAGYEGVNCVVPPSEIATYECFLRGMADGYSSMHRTIQVQCWWQAHNKAFSRPLGANTT